MCHINIWTFVNLKNNSFWNFTGIKAFWKFTGWTFTYCFGNLRHIQFMKFTGWTILITHGLNICIQFWKFTVHTVWEIYCISSLWNSRAEQYWNEGLNNYVRAIYSYGDSRTAFILTGWSICVIHWLYIHGLYVHGLHLKAGLYIIRGLEKSWSSRGRWLSKKALSSSVIYSAKICQIVTHKRGWFSNRKL